MKLSYNWLKELTGCKLSSEKMAEILNLQVAAVENFKKMGDGLDKIIVAEILEIKKHPQADKLQLVKVKFQIPDSRFQILQVVCGAFNINVGDKVPLALVGAKLANGIAIKESVIRGQKSCGMLCAEDELGVGEDHAGILILDKSAKVGEKIAKVLGLDDTIIDIETVALSHRPDLFGHLGFAREMAAVIGKKLQSLSKNSAFQRLQKIATTETRKKKETQKLKIKVEDSRNCPRYMGVTIDGIKITPSPAWLQNRLRNLGIRPINNVVDITNYVLLEVGQPLHAFDFDKISSVQIQNPKSEIRNKSKIKNSKQIIIRRAKEGEKLLCLDGVERKLDSDILVIADAKNPIALAGIIGGEYSGITEKTKTIVIESANFNPVVIRKGAKKVGLRTEANIRFEKGLPLIFAEQGMKRAIELVQQIAGGKVVSKIYDAKSKEVEKKLKTKKVINVETKRIIDLIGEEISEKQITKFLKALGFTTKKSGKVLRIAVPVHRNDVEYPEDVIEEISRLYGYQKIKPQPIEGKFTIVPGDPLLTLEKNLKNILVGLGFDEVYNYSFYGEKTADFLRLKKDEHLELANPMNPEQRYLRISLLPKILENAVKNTPAFENFRIFEIGKIYRTRIDADQNTDQRRFIRENPRSNPRESAFLEQPKYLAGLILERNKRIFYLIKGAVETILEKIGLDKKQISYQLSQSQSYQYLNNFTGVMINGEAVGLFGLIKKHIKDNMKISADVGVFEINLEKLIKLKTEAKVFEKISSYPPIIRDLAFLVPKNIVFSDLYQTIKNFHPLIYSVEPFDVFESEKLGKNVRNIAFHLTFQSFERTLTSGETDKIINNLVKILEQKFGVKLRNF